MSLDIKGTLQATSKKTKSRINAIACFPLELSEFLVAMQHRMRRETKTIKPKITFRSIGTICRKKLLICVISR